MSSASVLPAAPGSRHSAAEPTARAPGLWPACSGSNSILPLAPHTASRGQARCLLGLHGGAGLGQAGGCGAHRSRALLRPLLQQEAAALHHLSVCQLEGAQDLGRVAGSDPSGGPRHPPRRRTHLGQLQGALVLDAVVRQGQPEQGAVQPEALGRGRGGGVCEPCGGCPAPRIPAPRSGAPPDTHIRDVASARVPDVVEAQVERDQGPVATVQRGQSLAQQLRPVVVDVVVPQGQVRDAARVGGEQAR